MSGLAQCSPWCLEAWPPSRLRSPGSRWPWWAGRSPITALQAPAKAWASCELSMVAVGRLQGRSTSTRCPSSLISACEYGVSDIAASIVATLIHGSGIVLSIISIISIAQGASLGSKHSSRWCCSCVALDSRVPHDPPPVCLRPPLRRASLLLSSSYENGTSALQTQVSLKLVCCSRQFLRHLHGGEAGEEHGVFRSLSAA